jgi:uncharacterized protein involved in exopolysaccharide biosynthesis
MKEQSIDLLDVLITLLKSKKRILIHFICMSIIALIISLIWPKTYKAQTVFLPPDSKSNGLQSLVAENLAVNALNNNNISAPQVETFVESRETKEKIIEKFDLIHVYEHDGKINSLDLAIKQLDKNMKFKVIEDVGLGYSSILGMSLTIYDKDPNRCAEIANEYITLVDQQMRKMNTWKARGEYQFIQKRIENLEEELFIAREALKKFQLDNKIYEISAQTRLTLSNLAELRGEKLSLESQLEFFQKNISNSKTNYKANALKEKIKHIDTQLEKLETSESKDVMIGLERSIQMSSHFQDLYLDVEIHSKVISFLRKELEEKKLHALNETPLIRVIDKARAPQWKASPKRALIVIGIVFCYMFLLCFFILFQGYYKKQKELGSSKTKKIDEVFDLLRPFRKSK